THEWAEYTYSTYLEDRWSVETDIKETKSYEQLGSGPNFLTRMLTVQASMLMELRDDSLAMHPGAPVAAAVHALGVQWDDAGVLRLRSRRMRLDAGQRRRTATVGNPLGRPVATRPSGSTAGQLQLTPPRHPCSLRFARGPRFRRREQENGDGHLWTMVIR
ncbi:MAG: hypothetical protein LC620_08275, partial [Halobacteriales archaeon]|nr:hypothetical protein [Halobacteriales archaeon]